MRGLSLRKVANQLQPAISHTALSKFEKGQMMPTSSVLIALSNFFSVRPDFFFEMNPITLSKIEFRKRANLPKSVQTRIIHQAQEFFERYLEVEAVLDQPNYKIVPYDLTLVHESELIEKAEQAAINIRTEWGLGHEPIANVREMLEDHGVKVYEVDNGSARFDALAGWAGNVPVIVLSESLNDDSSRKRFSALHELGHLVLNLPPGLDKKFEENLCHRFAGEMLIPKVRVFEELGRNRLSWGVTDAELIAMKAQWGMSMAAIMHRARDLNVIDQGHYIAFRKKFSCLKWNTGEPGRWSGSEKSTRFEQLVHRAASSRLISVSKAAGLIGVSVRDFERQAIHAS